MLVNDGTSKGEAEKFLRTTDSADKNEILFSRFGVNYSTLSAMHRKGSCLLRTTCIDLPQPLEETLPSHQAPPLHSVQSSASRVSVKEDEGKDAPEVAGIAGNQTVETISEPRGIEATDQTCTMHTTAHSFSSSRMEKGEEKTPHRKIKEKKKIKKHILTLHTDLIRDAFWKEYGVIDALK